MMTVFQTGVARNCTARVNIRSRIRIRIRVRGAKEIGARRVYRA